MFSIYHTLLTSEEYIFTRMKECMCRTWIRIIFHCNGTKMLSCLTYLCNGNPHTWKDSLGIQTAPFFISHPLILWFQCFCFFISWWHHQMETFSMLLALCEGIHRSLVDSPHKSHWRRALVFLWSVFEQMAEQTIETPKIWDAITLIMMPLYCS